jgi:hypothetical protein
MTFRSPRKLPTTTSIEQRSTISGRRQAARCHLRPHDVPSENPDSRLRLAGRATDRSPRPRAAGVLRAASLRRRRAVHPRLQAAGHHPLGRSEFGLRGRGLQGAAGGVRTRRARARHLLRHADHGRAVGRQGRKLEPGASSAMPKCAPAATRAVQGHRGPRNARAMACSTSG